MIEALFDRLVDAVSDVLPDFGERLAVDSNAIPSWASHPAHDSTPDGRRDLDADYGKKDYRGQRDDGTIWSKVTTWFGYKIHLIVDAPYELPVAWTVTKASTADITEAAPLLKQLQTRHPLVLQSAKFFTGDRGYDDTKRVTLCWDTYPIKPVIDIRNMWKSFFRCAEKAHNGIKLEGLHDIEYNRVDRILVLIECLFDF